MIDFYNYSTAEERAMFVAKDLHKPTTDIIQTSRRHQIVKISDTAPGNINVKERIGFCYVIKFFIERVRFDKIYVSNI